ncbi:PAS domain S-box-containing protein [Terribacillus aidingensis]|uniref:PAS domain S-box-containing protein n=1 Tax=Terribacillus aidingensis TaxID=586416 RepID=A0A285NYI0_9BACI|nr:PAS domain S-box protein [Terribacillus aidingensis]SNZ13983.1 PAS domain S-box-containing protein [Terribacillus aidingensis]
MSEAISKIDYREVIEYALNPLIVHTDLKILYVNAAAEAFFKGNRNDIVGASPLDIFQESSKSSIDKRIQSAYETPAEVIEETIFKLDGEIVDVELYCHPILIGNKKAIQTYITDISERKEAEKKQQLLTKQINELSATLVPLLKGIAVLPLVGEIDESCASQLFQLVPEKAKQQSVDCLIIDFSGTYQLHQVVTDYLFKLSHVLTLLGIKSIFTGIQPSHALEAANLEINQFHVPTMTTVKDALEHLGVH